MGYDQHRCEWSRDTYFVLSKDDCKVVCPSFLDSTKTTTKINTNDISNLNNKINNKNKIDSEIISDEQAKKLILSFKRSLSDDIAKEDITKNEIIHHFNNPIIYNNNKNNH